MASSPFISSLSLNGWPCGWPLKAMTVPLPGIQSMVNVSPVWNFFCSVISWLIRVSAGASLATSSAPVLSAKPFMNCLLNSWLSTSRRNVRLMRLGPGAAKTSSGVAAFLPRYRPATRTLKMAL